MVGGIGCTEVGREIGAGISWVLVYSLCRVLLTLFVLSSFFLPGGGGPFWLFVKGNSNSTPPLQAQPPFSEGPQFAKTTKLSLSSIEALFGF